MVYLSRIYTRTGDAGDTTLGDGTRVPKTHPRVSAYGQVDELNSLLGVVCATPGLVPKLRGLLRSIQNDLFDLGADLCVPEADIPPPTPPLRVRADQVTRLEHAIDHYNTRLQPLHSFVLPGGSPAAAALHQARTVCRRAEVAVVALAQQEPVNPAATQYMNRLSDLLFVLARVCNADGADDVLWTPGGDCPLPIDPPDA
jgi:cob(I)alamin adenosyltransferase